jgi:peptidyl-dipeptidase A
MLFNNCGKSDMDKKGEKFIDNYVKKVKKLERDLSLSYWNAAVTGKESYYSRYEELVRKISDIRSDKKDFIIIEEIRNSGKITSPELKREIDILYNLYLQNQIPKELRDEIIVLSTKLDKEFATYRAKINGKEITENEIDKILKTSINSEERKKYWEASKEIGKLLYPDFIRLIKLRNKAARELGFKNYYIMALETSEQSEEEVLAIFDELAKLTDVPFKRVKREIDKKLAERYGIESSDIMPWHYEDPYFQGGVSIYKDNLDNIYKGKDLIKIALKFYDSIGINLNDVIDKSDIYEKKGKNPHAFEIMIGRSGDVRVLLNIKDDTRWMDTTLHELGHAAYSKYIDKKLPFVLREESHIFITEAIAMLFGRLSKNPLWIEKSLGVDKNKIIGDELYKSLQSSQLIFSRWAQVMMRFERAMYYNPDQDLNTLWWKLKEKYQLLRKPEGRDFPDYAAKIHIISDPVYYHNYMLGELLASQLNHYIAKNIYKNENRLFIPYFGKKEIGDFLINKIFKEGAEYRWDKLIEKATGEELTPKYFADQFIK